MSKQPTAPKGLRPATAKWWRSITSDYEMDGQAIRTLELAARAWDRHETARELIEAEGLVFLDRWNKPRPHPAAAIARDSAILFARLCREIGLNTQDSPPEASTP